MSAWPGDASMLWSAVAIHLWQTTLVLAVLVVLDRLLVHAPARYRVALWWLATLKLIVPASMLAVWLQPRGGLVATSDVITRVRLLVGPLDPVLRPAALQRGSWPAVLLTAAWALGVAGLGLLLWSRWRRLPGAGRPGAADPALRAAAEACAIDPHTVTIVPGRGTPCLMGVLRPRIVLPEAALQALDRAELCAVLIHEETHRRRRDPLRQLALLPLALAYWFYPPTWWVLRRLGEAEESACDEAVLAAGVTPAVYGRAIARAVGSAVEIPLGAVALAGSGRGALARRIRQIPELHRRDTMSRHRIALVLAAVAVVAAAFAADSVALPGLQERSFVTEPQEGAEGQVLRRTPRVDELDRLGARGDRPITLQVREEKLGAVLDRIARSAGILMRPGLDGDGLDLDQRVSVTATNSTVKQALRIVAEAAQIAYTVEDDGTLLVWGGPFRIGGEVQAPERIHYVPPVYPELARRAELGGIVILEIEIDAAGNVIDADVLRGLGLGLDEAAVAAASQWKYRPTLFNGQPVPALLTVTVQFQLR